jgi:hypothetical protein
MEHNIEVNLTVTDYKTWDWSEVAKNKRQPQSFVNSAFLLSDFWEIKPAELH